MAREADERTVIHLDRHVQRSKLRKLAQYADYRRTVAYSIATQPTNPQVLQLSTTVRLYVAQPAWLERYVLAVGKVNMEEMYAFFHHELNRSLCDLDAVTQHHTSYCGFVAA
jgi:hypothetical protein